MSTAEHNKATFRRLHGAMNSRDPELISKALDEALAPDVQLSTPLPVDGTGAEAQKQVWAMLLRAFPDLHVEIEDLIAEDDKVVCRNTVTGTHLGDYMGVLATGRQITWNEIFIFRFTNNQITETHGVVNIATQMRQLGLLPG
ncbi:ester cyclase [Kribbella sp. NPDC050820]|uniref:ester cyclase n=1 Tax=Kribbella sp. NPDC050820 TaxID=3155408 RepID=UPI0033F1867B